MSETKPTFTLHVEEDGSELVLRQEQGRWVSQHDERDPSRSGKDPCT